MSFTLPLNRPEMNPRLKTRPPSTWATQAQRTTEPSLWKEAGNVRLLALKAPAHPIDPDFEFVH